MSLILTLNGGSSSIRFACYAPRDLRHKVLAGKIERIGLPGASLSVDAHSGQRAAHSTLPADANDQRGATAFLLDWLQQQPALGALAAVGHRVVHGMDHFEPELITPALLGDLKKIIPSDPEHLPGEIALIESVTTRYPALPQVACFDTQFHRDMPRVASVIALPRRYQSKGVRRYGFHGLSCTYLMTELARLDGPRAERDRIILAHLGNGASITAVSEGRSVDTSMSFTPAAGLVMSSRSGDLDPGLMSFLARTENLDASAFQTMINHESGLLGISELSPDIRDLLAKESTDQRASEAVAIFCYQVKKWIGAYAAVLGGLDTLVFAGGIGENSAVVRSRICAGLEFIGIDLDPGRNAGNAAVISAVDAPVTVRVIATDEESVIAGATMRVAGHRLPH